ncbi:hypothetical protein BGZ76_008646 [Entomortierella beljakovae]|nr:hypothetical protein BGZ76_008646 [Entomortierella beljakovae]
MTVWDDTIELSSTLYDINLPASTPSKMEEVISDKTPKVLISGAGISGLFLANLFEKADIPYEIFERAKEVLPLGTVMCLTANILPAFEQLGLYEDLLKIAYPASKSKFYEGNMSVIGEFTSQDHKEV